MKRLFFSCLLFCLTAIVVLPTTLAQDSTDEFKAIFDGKTLDGWSGNTELWSVEDGAITGTTTAETKLQHNQFITWTEGELKDFELKLQFRIQGGNSGIQFRSKAFGEEGEFRVGGYQADIDSGMRYMGIPVSYTHLTLPTIYSV